MPKSEASSFTSAKPWACISIGCEPGDWPKINKCQLVDCLQLSFADIDKVTDGLIAFSMQDAQKIWEFVDKVWDQVDVLVVHCLAGQCRSPAVAAAISKIKYGDDNMYFAKYTPNTRVYNGLLKYYYQKNKDNI
jgi:predicted protein tyrosine phosphatase